MTAAGKRPPQDSQDASYWQGKLRKRLTPKAGAVETAPLDLGIEPVTTPAPVASSAPAVKPISEQLGITNPELAALADEYDALSQRAYALWLRGEQLDDATSARREQLADELERQPWPLSEQLTGPVRVII